MSQYAITISPDEASREYNVRLCGPGIDSEGRRYVFANTSRCATFIEAVNFAYQQGLRDGLAATEWVVTGTTPDNMAIRRDGWWARWKRRWLPAI